MNITLGLSLASFLMFFVGFQNEIREQSWLRSGFFYILYLLPTLMILSTTNLELGVGLNTDTFFTAILMLLSNEFGEYVGRIYIRKMQGH